MSQLEREKAAAMARCAVPEKKYDLPKNIFSRASGDFAGTTPCPVWARLFRRRSTVAGYKIDASQALAMRNVVSGNATGG
jgi:hypothetical protein